MSRCKEETAQPLAPEDQPQPHSMPTEGDEVRDIGKRAADDDQSAKQSTDEGYDMQRAKAPAESPTKRSGITDGSKG